MRRVPPDVSDFTERERVLAATSRCTLVIHQALFSRGEKKYFVTGRDYRDARESHISKRACTARLRNVSTSGGVPLADVGKAELFALNRCERLQRPEEDVMARDLRQTREKSLLSESR